MVLPYAAVPMGQLSSVESPRLAEMINYVGIIKMRTIAFQASTLKLQIFMIGL